MPRLYNRKFCHSCHDEIKLDWESSFIEPKSTHTHIHTEWAAIQYVDIVTQHGGKY